jgi:hypothetical protein
VGRVPILALDAEADATAGFGRRRSRRRQGCSARESWRVLQPNEVVTDCDHLLPLLVSWRVPFLPSKDVARVPVEKLARRASSRFTGSWTSHAISSGSAWLASGAAVAVSSRSA